MPYETQRVLSNRRLAADIFEMKIICSGPVSAGQFFMLKAGGGASLLPRPISVCDAQDGTLTFCYRVVGRGTGELAALREGDILSVNGPLGNGFPLAEAPGAVALVGGGIGVAPLLYTARHLRERATKLDIFAGFRDEPFLTDRLRETCDGLHIATESGESGHRGLVTGLFSPQDYSAVFCCGPMPMMRAVTAACMAAGVPVWISLENKMACGIGACLVCTCTGTDGKNRRTCTDGPVFRGEGIDFDA